MSRSFLANGQRSWWGRAAWKGVVAGECLQRMVEKRCRSGWEDGSFVVVVFVDDDDVVVIIVG